MLFKIAGRVIAGLLVALLGTIVFYAFSNGHTHDSNLVYLASFLLLGLTGVAASASIGTLSTTRSSRVKSVIWASALIFLVLSFASIFTGGSSISAAFILTSLVIISMITKVLLKRGDVSWKIAGRVIAVVIVLFTIGVLALHANNCGAKCLNPGFTVPFVGLGLLGAVLSVWAGQLVPKSAANTRMAFNSTVAIYVVLTIGTVLSGLSYMNVGWVIVALALIGAGRQRFPDSDPQDSTSEITVPA